MNPPEAIPKTPGKTPSKTIWRQRLRGLRQAVPASTAAIASHRAAEYLRDSELWMHSQHIALYLPNDHELGTIAVVEAARSCGKTLYLPVVRGKSLDFAVWEPKSALKANRFGIGEPVTMPVPANTIDLLLLPLVGFTASGYRLGMGGGFYDRFLASEPTPRAHKMGMGYNCQREDELERLREAWDIDLDSALTECGLLRMAHK